jgi:hypothetical protein
MNTKRGLFRIWIVLSVLWIVFGISLSYGEVKSEFKEMEKLLLALSSIKTLSDVNTISMNNQSVGIPFDSDYPFKKFQQKYPQYGNISTDVLADTLYQNFYSNMPRELYNEKIGLNSQPAWAFDPIVNEDKIPNPWGSVLNAIIFAFSFPVIILVLWIIGAWICKGFTGNKIA